MYSAGAHQKALDRLSDTDGNRNSVYTRSLIPLLTQPGRSIQVIAKDVQVKVKALAESVERAQHPAYYDQIIGDFYLVKGDGDRPAARPQPQPQVAAPVPVQLAPATSAPEDLEQAVKRRGEMAYLECVSSNELTCYKSFLADFPDHPRAKQVEKIVRSQIELPRFRACMSSKTYDDKLEQCHLYLDSFPNGRYRRQAEEVIEQALLETETRPQAHEPAPVAPVPPPPAPAARTFTLYSGYDLYGGDYGRLPGKVDYDACYSACRSDTRCKAFTYNTQARACFLKSQVPQRTPFTNAISGVLATLPQPGQSVPQVSKSAGACGNGFTTYNNSDFFGNDIAGYSASFNQCRNQCLGNARCRGFSWIRKSVKKRCWLKYALAAPSTNAQVISCARN
jgi:hypothetical protein